jgi:(E)-4-hydroxy-3-methylbut-2-enyl-diphosphate synthase
MTAMPLVADIHFDHNIALRCLDFPIAKLRINPGNIGGEERVKAVLEKAAEKHIPIRIGVNAGSLPRDLYDTGRSVPEALVEAAERELLLFDKHGFTDVVVSLKASSAAHSVEAARLFRKHHGHPLHVGVTEAGPIIAGVVRNTAALVELLKDGIGDTVRVSLSSTMENEIIAAREILALFDDRRADNNRVRLVSCPRCGRAGFDTHGFTQRWETRLYAMATKAVIAVMGCVVNGPGEAREADLGVTGLGNSVVFFRKGVKVRTLELGACDKPEADRLVDAAFVDELNKL